MIFELDVGSGPSHIYRPDVVNCQGNSQALGVSLLHQTKTIDLIFKTYKNDDNSQESCRAVICKSTAFLSALASTE